jgi:hypothetical protein
MILATHGIIGSGAAFDADAVAFFNRVTTAGGTLSATEKAAVNTLVVKMKADGTWTPMKAIYPMVGASAAACAQNLRSASFTGTFSSGWTFASTGVTPNGVSAYMDTGLVANGNISQNSSHISYYSRTDNALLAVMMGTYVPNATYLTARFAAAGPWHANNSTETNANITEWTDSRGFFISNRISSSGMSVFRNTTKQSDNSLPSTGLSSFPIWIGAQNDSTTTPRLPTNKECAFSTIGDGLTDTQASNFYTAVQTFQTTLSRQV